MSEAGHGTIIIFLFHFIDPGIQVPVERLLEISQPGVACGGLRPHIRPTGGE